MADVERSLTYRPENIDAMADVLMQVFPQELSPRSYPKERRRMVVLALMEPSPEDLSKFKYTGTSDEQFIETVYSDRLINSRGEKTKTEIRNNKGAAYQAVQSFIDNLQNLGTKDQGVVDRAIDLVIEIRKSNYMYAKLSAEEIIEMLQRKRTPLGVKIEETEEVKINLPIKLENFHGFSKQELAVYLLMLVNKDGTNYKYPDAKTALSRFYKDYALEIRTLTPGRKRDFKKYSPEGVDAQVEKFISLLSDYERLIDEDIQPPFEIRKFMLWASEQELYEKYNVDDLIGVITRKVPFADIIDLHLQEALTPAEQQVFLSQSESLQNRDIISFSSNEKYFLAQLLSSLGHREQGLSFGINFLEDDKTMLAETIGQMVDKDLKIGMTGGKVGIKMAEKLKDFFKDPKAFVQEIRDPQAKALLHIIIHAKAPRLLRLIQIS